MTRPRRQRPSTSPPAGTPAAAAASELTAIVAQHDDIELITPPSLIDGALECRLRIDTSGFVKVAGGLEVQPKEDIVLTIASHPLVPPSVRVEHLRWLGEPHVMEGCRLCIYLDHDREWSPRRGVAGMLTRIWDWFNEAIGAKFDARTAMHHAVGGVQHAKPGAPTLVVRTIPGPVLPGIRRIALRQRTDQRVDVVGWDRPATEGERAGLAIFTSGPLPLGIGGDLSSFLSRIARPVFKVGELTRRGFPDRSMLTERLLRAATLSDADPLYVLIGARNLALSGSGAYDLAGFTAPSDAVRAACDPEPPAGPRPAPTLTFLRADDGRPEITTRRDDRRPVGWYAGKRVELWGCGAIGSWMAEILVRAGVRRLVVRDLGLVSSGLLVRQNYQEVDVGVTKAQALATRLRAITDTTQVLAGDSVGHCVPTDCDLLIDATVNATVAAAIDGALTHETPGAMIVQVATDTLSSTLGIMTVVPGDAGRLLSDIDGTIHDHVTSDAALEAFTTLWDAGDDVLFAPARGCSTPTFRGSSADAMAIASTALSLLGPVAEARVAGGYLFALPHAPSDAPARTWIAA